MKIKKLLLGIAFIASSQFIMAGPYEDLIDACKKGNLEGVKTAVESGANVNQLDAGGNAPIASATFWPEIVSYLIEKGADPNLGTNSALYSAVVNYSVDVVRILLEKGANVNKGTENPAYDPGAYLRGLVEDEKAKGKKANKAIIAAFEAELANMPPPTAASSVSPLSYAMGSSNCVECIKLLLEAGALKDVGEWNPIYSLVSSAQDPSVRIDGLKNVYPVLEGMGYVLPDWYKNLDETRCGQPEEILKLLIQHGAKINDLNTSEGYTPLGRALYYQKISMSKLMLQMGADPTVTSKITSDPKAQITTEVFPICQASEVGDLELMQLMLEKGANINSLAKGMSLMNMQKLTGGENYTPLNLALANGKIDIAAYLIEKGADLSIGVQGTTFVKGNISKANLICQVIVTNKTPIYWAIESGSLSTVQILTAKLKDKASPEYTIKTLGGGTTDGIYDYSCKFTRTKYSPSQWANEIGNKEIEEYLSTNGL